MGARTMTLSAVEVFLRAKPVRSPSQSLTVQTSDHKAVFRVSDLCCVQP